MTRECDSDLSHSKFIQEQLHHSACGRGSLSLERRSGFLRSSQRGSTHRFRLCYGSLVIRCSALDRKGGTMNHKDEIPITAYQTLAEFRYQLRRFLRTSRIGRACCGP